LTLETPLDFRLLPAGIQVDAHSFRTTSPGTDIAACGACTRRANAAALFADDYPADIAMRRSPKRVLVCLRVTDTL